MKTATFFSVALIFSVSAIPSTNISPPQVDGDIIILAIMGQSNASGYSICPDVLPPVPEGIYNFGNDYVLRPAQEPIDSGINQVDMVSYDSVSRCGSSISIATVLNHITGRQVVIVPCARGGSFIVQWLPSYSRDTLYGSCLKRIKTVDAGGNHKVMVFFYQGESDAGYSLDAVNAWDDRFITIVNALKSDLSSNDPDFVFAQMGRTTNYQMFPYMNELANEQAKISIMDSVLMVSSYDLSLDSIVHLDYASQQIIGERTAVKLYWLAKQGY